jgi:hypothetical protein
MYNSDANLPLHSVTWDTFREIDRKNSTALSIHCTRSILSTISSCCYFFMSLLSKLLISMQAREELFFESYEAQIKNEQDSRSQPEPGAPPRAMDGMGMPPMGPMGPMPGMPMMPPMMMNPMMMQMMASQMGMMMPGMMMGPGRGLAVPGRVMPPFPGRGGGGPVMGPNAGPPGRRGRGGREYFDFDAPANQREQLNYGDI